MQARVEQKLSGSSFVGGNHPTLPQILTSSPGLSQIRGSCIGEVLMHMRPHTLKQEISGMKGGMNIPPL
jgi:hypothetical protein